MQGELEQAIRELEAKLPALRRLIAESELELTLSNEAQSLAALLVQALTLLDEISSLLRGTLLQASGQLGGGEPIQEERAEPHRHRETIGEMDRLLAALMMQEQDAPGDEGPSEDPPGGATVPAVPHGPAPTRTPGNERTFAEAKEPPRDP